MWERPVGVGLQVGQRMPAPGQDVSVAPASCGERKSPTRAALDQGFHTRWGSVCGRSQAGASCASRSAEGTELLGVCLLEQRQSPWTPKLSVPRVGDAGVAAREGSVRRRVLGSRDEATAQGQRAALSWGSPQPAQVWGPTGKPPGNSGRSRFHTEWDLAWPGPCLSGAAASFGSSPWRSGPRGGADRGPGAGGSSWASFPVSSVRLGASWRGVRVRPRQVHRAPGAGAGAGSWPSPQVGWEGRPARDVGH